MQIKNGNIEFKNVDFKYDSEKNKVLDFVNLKMLGGKMGFNACWQFSMGWFAGLRNRRSLTTASHRSSRADRGIPPRS